MHSRLTKIAQKTIKLAQKLQKQIYQEVHSLTFKNK